MSHAKQEVERGKNFRLHYSHTHTQHPHDIQVNEIRSLGLQDSGLFSIFLLLLCFYCYLVFVIHPPPPHPADVIVVSSAM